MKCSSTRTRESLLERVARRAEASEYCRTFHRARRLFLAFPLDFFEKIRKRYRVTLQIDNEIGDNDSPLTSLNSGWVEGK